MFIMLLYPKKYFPPRLGLAHDFFGCRYCELILPPLRSFWKTWAPLPAVSRSEARAEQFWRRVGDFALGALVGIGFQPWRNRRLGFTTTRYSVSTATTSALRLFGGGQQRVKSTAEDLGIFLPVEDLHPAPQVLY